jgi:hypothetical protein
MDSIIGNHVFSMFGSKLLVCKAVAILERLQNTRTLFLWTIFGIIVRLVAWMKLENKVFVMLVMDKNGRILGANAKLRDKSIAD